MSNPRLDITASPNSLLAEDVVSEVFAKLSEIRSSLHEIKEARKFLFVMVKRRCLDELAKHVNKKRPTSSQDWLVFRYAEILLNYAEAAYELTKTNDALSAVNQIRDRAGIAALTSIDRDRIRNERKVELAFEGHRYWDLRRWRTAVTDLSKPLSGIRYILDLETAKYQLRIIDKVDGESNILQFRSENYYLPITNQRTSNNPKLVENPGY